MRLVILILLLIVQSSDAYCYLIYQFLKLEVALDKASYFEGEKITFLITLTNTDNERSHPVLIPHTQNTGQKLFYLNAYDKANNTMLLRYSEERILKMMVHDTGSVIIKILKPLEQITIPIYLNDFENYFNYHTQNASHHSFGVPLFAGIYKINITYNPRGTLLGDSIYSYYSDFDRNPSFNGKLLMHENGVTSHMLELKIKRSADSIVSIEGKKYYIKTDGYRYYYFSKYVQQITTDTTCYHITDIPPDSCSLKNEYFYSHFNYLYAEYINRFEDGDIREYRKFSDWCPEYLYTERYNELKQKTHFEIQLLDKRFYSVIYNQPRGNLSQETYCTADGTSCNVTKYIYNNKGELKRKITSQFQPCVETLLDGVKRSLKGATILDVR